MATDYRKWDKVDYKSLGASSSSSDDDDDRQQPSGDKTKSSRGRGTEVEDDSAPVTTEEYIRRSQEVEKAKARLKELEREQEVLQKKLAASEASSKRTERLMQVGFLAMALLLMFVQYYFTSE